MIVTEHTMTANELGIHYLEAGEPTAPPVVLLHGGGIDSAWVSWRRLIPELARTHRVLAPNLPGYGRSESPPEDVPYTTEFLVATVRALLDLWMLDKIVLVGLSMGGATALGVALADPARIDRLVLAGCYGLQDYAPWQPFSSLALGLPPALPRVAWWTLRNSRGVMRMGLTAIFANPFALTREIMDDVHDAVHIEAFYAWLQTEVTRGRCRTNYTSQLGDLHVPTLLVHGRRDPSIPVRWAARAAERLPDARLVVVPSCGHWVNREQPEAFNR
ncbi:MAG: alpha/beta hydrolase, partial [Chloroflexota bacterium]